MIQKRLLVPDRRRTIPKGFGWIDRRFVQDGFLKNLGPSAGLLYYFLASVSDANGLSFWADPTVGRILEFSPGVLVAARDRLVRGDLAAYQYPLYQLLSLPPAAPPERVAEPSPPRARRGLMSGPTLFLGALGVEVPLTQALPNP